MRRYLNYISRGRRRLRDISLVEMYRASLSSRYRRSIGVGGARDSDERDEILNNTARARRLITAARRGGGRQTGDERRLGNDDARDASYLMERRERTDCRSRYRPEIFSAAVTHVWFRRSRTPIRTLGFIKTRREKRFPKRGRGRVNNSLFRRNAPEPPEPFPGLLR